MASEIKANKLSPATGTDLTIGDFGDTVSIAANISGNLTVDTNTLHVDSTNNRVGIGTASPAQKLVVSGIDSRIYIENNNTDINMDDSANGQISIDGNGYNFGIALNADGANLYTNSSVRGLIFGTNETERMRIDVSGNLLVGTTTNNGRISSKSSDSASSKALYCENSSGAKLFELRGDGVVQTGLAANSPYNLTNASAANVHIASNGILYRSTSSLKYKNDVRDAVHGLADVMRLRPVTYKSKINKDADPALFDLTQGETVFGGLIAEEVHDAGLTEFVQYAEDGSPDALAYGNMASLCIKAIQEQQAIIESQASSIADLTTRLEALEAN